MYLISLNVKEKLSKFNLEIYNIDVMENSPLPLGALEIQKKTKMKMLVTSKGRDGEKTCLYFFAEKLCLYLVGRMRGYNS